MSLRGNKRSSEEANLEKADGKVQKKANELCQKEVAKTAEALNIAISKMTPQERELFTMLFKFPVISSNQQCQV